MTVLELDSVGKSFGGRRVLSSATLRAEAGCVTALLGRNGGGKSTLLRIAAGLLKADYGRVRYRSALWTRPSLATLARHGVFFLPDHDLLAPGLRVGDQLEMIARTFGSTPAPELLARLDLTEILSRNPLTLSGGERRRADFAAALFRMPVCLLADEPLRELAPRDAECGASVLRALAERGCAVVMTGHDVEPLLAVADRVVWCTEGTTYDLGPPSMARQHWAFQRGYLSTA